MTAGPAAADAAVSAPALVCANCRKPMRRLVLVGHYGRPVELDLCEPCHLLWFDSLEAARLTGASMLDLVGAMAAAQAQPHHPLAPDLRCPRCAGAVKAVHNRSRYGASQQLECGRGHGAWSSFAQWLSDRGLVRPLTSADRAELISGAGTTWHCVNCGAALAASDASSCAHCGSLVGVVDIARLAAALDPDGASAGHEVHGRERLRHSFRCHACGHSAPGLEGLRCPQCGATQVSTDLRAAHQAVSVLGPVLQAHQRAPAPHVRERRLRALEGDLERRREAVRELERSARPQGKTDDDDPPPSGVQWLDVLLGRAGVPWGWRAAFWIGAALLLAWWFAG